MVLPKDQQNWQTLARLNKEKKKEREREKAPGTKVINESGNFTTDSIEINNITKKYYMQSHSNKLYNLDEMDSFQETQIPPRLNHTKIG